MKDILDMECVLHGHSLQIPFTYKGYSFWIGADYYRRDDAFEVHYKVGMADSWFATRIDMEIDSHQAHIGEQLMTEDVGIEENEHIEDVIQRYLEAKKEQAAERYLLSAYYFASIREIWKENGNEKHAEQFKKYLKYGACNGVRESALVRINHNDHDIMVFCYSNEAGTAVDLLASYEGQVFVKVAELHTSETGMAEIGRTVLQTYTSNTSLFWNTVRTGELAATLANSIVNETDLEQVYGRVDIWNY